MLDKLKDWPEEISVGHVVKVLWDPLHKMSSVILKGFSVSFLNIPVGHISGMLDTYGSFWNWGALSLMSCTLMMNSDWGSSGSLDLLLIAWA